MPRRKGGSLVLSSQRFAAVKEILVPYRRVSTREQADKGAGLPAQFTALSAGLEFRQQRALSWDYVDRGKSGKDLNREALTKALDAVQQGLASGIIVSKLDRLSRSLLDFATLMAQADQQGWNIVALDLNIDLSTPSGKLMAGVLAVFAQFERDVIRQRTRDGLAEKREQGVRLGRRRSISDELLEAVVSHWHAEHSYSAVARWLNGAGVDTPHGGKMWYPATIQKLLESQDGRAVIQGLEKVA